MNNKGFAGAHVKEPKRILLVEVKFGTADKALPEKSKDLQSSQCQETRVSRTEENEGRWASTHFTEAGSLKTPSAVREMFLSRRSLQNRTGE